MLAVKANSSFLPLNSSLSSPLLTFFLLCVKPLALCLCHIRCKAILLLTNSLTNQFKHKHYEEISPDDDGSGILARIIRTARRSAP